MYFSKKVTVTNFVLAVMVMLLHSQNVEQYTTVSQTHIPGIEFFISHAMGNLAVPLFFLISSYLFFRNYGYHKILEKYKSRIKSIFIPYLLWNFLYYLAFLILVTFPVSRYFMDTKRVEFSLNEIVQAVFNHKYNGVYWFMQQLIWFIAFAPVIWLLMRKKWGFIFPAMLLALDCFNIVLPFHVLNIRLDMLVYWCLGCYIARYGANWFESRGSRLRVSCDCLIFIMLLLMRFGIEFLNIEFSFGHGLQPLLLLANVITFWFALDLFQYKKTYWWMEITFFIYSVHPLLVDAVKKFMARILPDVPVLCMVNYFTAVGISLCLIIVLAWVLMKYAPWIWKVLNGGRCVLEKVR